MPPAAIAGAGLAYQIYQGQQQKKQQEEALRSQQAAAGAQNQGVEANEARKRELWNMFQGGFENAGSGFTPEMANARGAQPGDEDYFAALQRAAMSRAMMGLTQPTGTGLSQQLGSQNFLEAQQAGQDISGAAEAFADSILAKYGQGQGGGGQANAPMVDATDLAGLGLTGNGIGVPTSGSF